jgi:hypothetical protein
MMRYRPTLPVTSIALLRSAGALVSPVSRARSHGCASSSASMPHLRVGLGAQIASVVELEAPSMTRVGPRSSSRWTARAAAARSRSFGRAGADLVLVVESSALYGPKKVVVPPPPQPEGQADKSALQRRRRGQGQQGGAAVLKQVARRRRAASTVGTRCTLLLEG